MAEQQEQVTMATTAVLPRIQLSAAHWYGLVRTALAERAADLDALAKKTSDAGYNKEARAIRSDAQALRVDIAPQFAVQMPIPLDSMVTLEESIEAWLKSLKIRTPAQVAAHIALYATDLAEKAYEAGYQARQESPEAVAMQAWRRGLSGLGA